MDFPKNISRMLTAIIIIVSGIIIIITAALIIMSPGKAVPITNDSGNLVPGSLSEKTFIQINGVKQGMFIRSKDSSNPVLLYLHGGLPDYFLTKKYPTGMEDIFTVVWWEQRGSGISYVPENQSVKITPELMISDTRAVTNYLRKRFNQDKIYLMGHSGGTFTGIQAAAQAPELYHAYIGVAQMSNQLRSEVLAYDYMHSTFKSQNNQKMLRKLEAAPVSMSRGVSAEYLSLRDGAMHNLGIGTTHDMKSVFTGVFLPSLKTPEYTLMEKIKFWKGKSRSGVSLLWDIMLATDLSLQVTRLDIPVYFFHGTRDYTVSYDLAKDYFGKLQAPTKGFYIFSKSAHSPMFEEPKKLQRILKEDVLRGKNDLADL